jgi:hypothetical protein
MNALTPSEAAKPDAGTWKLARTAQCAKCPWIKGSNPHEIPNGYDEAKHRALACTIAKPGDLGGIFGTQRAMTCHQTHDAHCVGWLMNQLGPGNNIGLRLRLMTCENVGAIRLRGEQHETFEDTLP